MALNYASLQAAASRMIEQNGKLLTLKQHQATPTNPMKPWRGSGASSFAQTITCYGVIIPNDELDDKQSMRRGDATCYISATSFSTGTPPTLQDMVQFSFLIDDEGYSWHIHGVKITNPGPVRVLYELQLEH
jgi:hypothetical protein